MNARVVRRAAEPEGLAVVTINGADVHALDQLHRGNSPQPLPQAGDAFDASFSYQLDSEPQVLPADTTTAPCLRRLEGCSYEAVGQILSVDSESSDGRVQVAKVDCGGVVLPAPIDVNDATLIGRRVAFKVASLEVWRA